MTISPAQQPSQPIDEGRVPSLGLIEAALQHEDDSYRERANSVDTKAGVIVSAAAVIVALVGTKAGVAAVIGQGVAVMSGVAAVLALMPRVDKAIGPRQLRDRYLMADPLTTRLFLLNTRLVLHANNEQRMFVKFRRLKVAAVLLLGSAMAIVIGGIVNLIHK
jgi:hypothetical protein